MSRFVRIALLFCVLCLLFVTSTAAATPTYTLPLSAEEPPDTSAKAMVLLEAAGGTVLAQKNADERLPMASTTKIMTALVVIERMDIEQTISVPAEAVGVEGSSVYLFAGEQITVRTLLHALLLSSANDAATALAIASCGSVEAFADAMNQKAAELLLSDTHFCNPHGLHDDGHYTTARDLARLSAAALQNEVFAGIVATPRYTAPQNGTDATRLFLNHNKLLTRYDDAVGVKTGFTKKSGRCLVSAAERDGLLLIAVTLNDPADWQDHAALLDFGFSQYQNFTATPLTLTVAVVGGTKGEVDLVPSGTLSLTLPSRAVVECRIQAPRFLFGGFDANTPRGKLIYTANGQKLGEIALVSAEGVVAERPRGFFAAIGDFFSHIFSK